LIKKLIKKEEPCQQYFSGRRLTLETISHLSIHPQRSDDFRKQGQTASRCDRLVGPFNLEWQDALLYQEIALLVKVFTPGVIRSFSSKTPYTGSLYVSPRISMGNLGDIYFHQGRPLHF